MTTRGREAGDGFAERRRRLCEALAAEETALAQLLALSRRQGELMRQGDVPGLQRNAELWRPALQRAEAARVARRELTAEIAQADGPAADNESGGPVRRALEALAVTAAELGRQNARNRELADYCLGLVRQESELFRRCLLEDPAGRYGGDAGRAAAPPGGVVARQA